MSQNPATEITTLSNGLRVVSHHLSHVETAALGVWVSAGARHETEKQHGVAHLLEHMAFKGTASRSAQHIAEEIEEVGGELNAATGLDTTAYFARVLAGDDRVALEIIADILQNSTFAPDELDRERDVILQEIAGTEDSPEELAYDLLQSTAFPNQPVGRPILGTRKSVTSLQPSDIRQYLSDHYAPSRMVVSAAGAIHHEKLVRHVEALFGHRQQSKSVSVEAASYRGGIAASAKPFEQTHVLLGWPSPGHGDAAFYVAQVFSGLFGGGMSSRLFQEVREKRGLCYAIYASLWGLSDTGMLTVHAATNPAMVNGLVGLVAGELADIANRGPTAAELLRSKAQLKAGLLMALESSSVRAEQMARHLLTYDRLLPPAELVARVDAVSADDVRAFAAQLMKAEPTVTVAGSGKKSRDQAQQALELLAPSAKITTPRKPAVNV
jgi:predicted Zn-dependent peptidase